MHWLFCGNVQLILFFLKKNFINGRNSLSISMWIYVDEEGKQNVDIHILHSEPLATSVCYLSPCEITKGMCSRR